MSWGLSGAPEQKQRLHWREGGIECLRLKLWKGLSWKWTVLILRTLKTAANNEKGRFSSAVNNNGGKITFNVLYLAGLKPFHH